MQYIGQQKGFDPRTIVFLVFLLVAGAAGLFALTFINIPAPQNPVVKELDAKTFLENK